MDLELAGRHVLITGGTRGIGLACARVFLAEGAVLTLAGRDRAHLSRARSELDPRGIHRVQCLPADLADAQAALELIDEAERENGPVDVLVNSAGAARRTPFAELTPAAWEAAMRAKFFTYINVMDPMVRRMGERRRGVIVNVIGTGGKVASPTHLAGGAANAALMLATSGLASAWGPTGVRINAVNPSLTRTERLHEGFAIEARQREQSIEQVMARAVERVPLGRLAEPEDVANVVAFLASPRSGYVSGAIVGIDGAAFPIVV